jgi:hypothetical protein
VRSLALGLAALFVLAWMTGCTTRVADLVLVSNRNINGLPPPLKRQVVGRHCQIQWSLGQQPSLEEAIDRAQQEVPEANALTNVTVYVELHYYVLLQQLCFRVEGDAVAIPPTP